MNRHIRKPRELRAQHNAPHNVVAISERLIASGSGTTVNIATFPTARSPKIPIPGEVKLEKLKLEGSEESGKRLLSARNVMLNSPADRAIPLTDKFEVRGGVMPLEKMTMNSSLTVTRSGWTTLLRTSTT